MRAWMFEQALQVVGRRPVLSHIRAPTSRKHRLSFTSDPQRGQRVSRAIGALPRSTPDDMHIAAGLCRFTDRERTHRTCAFHFSNGDIRREACQSQLPRAHDDDFSATGRVRGFGFVRERHVSETRDRPERARPQTDPASDTPLGIHHRQRAVRCHRQRQIRTVDHAELTSGAGGFGDDSNGRLVAFDRPRKRRHRDGQEDRRRGQRRAPLRSEDRKQEHDVRIEDHRTGFERRVCLVEHPRRERNGGHDERPAHHPHPPVRRQPVEAGLSEVPPERPADGGRERKMSHPDEEEGNPAAITGDRCRHGQRAERRSNEVHEGFGDRLSADVPDEPVSGDTGQPHDDERKHPRQPSKASARCEPLCDERPPSVDDGRHDEHRTRHSMDAAHHTLDRVIFHGSDGAVGVFEAEFEEQRDVETGDRDDDQQEDADRSCVRQRVEPVRADEATNRALHPIRRRLEAGQQGAEPNLVGTTPCRTHCRAGPSPVTTASIQGR